MVGSFQGIVKFVNVNDFWLDNQNARNKTMKLLQIQVSSLFYTMRILFWPLEILETTFGTVVREMCATKCTFQRLPVNYRLVDGNWSERPKATRRDMFEKWNLGTFDKPFESVDLEGGISTAMQRSQNVGNRTHSDNNVIAKLNRSKPGKCTFIDITYAYRARRVNPWRTRFSRCKRNLW